MVYTYEMWDDDGREVSIGLYETGSRPDDRVSDGDLMPVDVRGNVYVLDSDDLLLKAHSFFRRKYEQPAADDFYLRWASVITFSRENARALANENVVQMKEGVMVGVDANFVRMLLDSYQASPLEGGFPTSELHEGEVGFNVGKCIDAWKSGKRFTPVDPDPTELWTPGQGLPQ
ncbi:MAG: hypothetical protein HQ478_12310 [Chloroflexi bacterium]|nr:hypothetical protein [Chloroflexota bacterium]